MPYDNNDGPIYSVLTGGKDPPAWGFDYCNGTSVVCKEVDPGMGWESKAACESHPTMMSMCNPCSEGCVPYWQMPSGGAYTTRQGCINTTGSSAVCDSCTDAYFSPC